MDHIDETQDLHDQSFLFRSLFGGFVNDQNEDQSNWIQLGGKERQDDSGSAERPGENEGEGMDANEGSPPHPMIAKSIYFKKINTLFIVFFISLLLAIITIKRSEYLNAAFKTTTPDLDAEDDYKTKWRHLLTYTILFIVLIILYHIVIVISLFVFLVIVRYIWYHIFGIKKSYQVVPNTKRFIRETFWEYRDDQGMQHGLIGYYALALCAVLGMYVFYLLYTYLAKGYFQNMYYQVLYNPQKDVEDEPQPVKYIYQYATFTLLMMLFVLLLLNFDKLSDNRVLFIYNIMFTFVYVILTINILRTHMIQAWKPFWMLSIILFFVFKFYQAPLRAIAKYMS